MFNMSVCKIVTSYASVVI